MNFGDFKDGKAQQPLPASLAPHESEIYDFAQLCNKTCKRILALLSLGLEVSHPLANTHPSHPDIQSTK
jgi:isopenicillin N synthase-like dioxygenase